MGRLTAKQIWRKETRKFFRDIIKKYEIDAQHHAVFLGTCENLDAFHIANQTLSEEGLTVSVNGGVPRKHPAFQIKKDSWSGFLMGLKALGLYEYKKTGRPPGG